MKQNDGSKRSNSKEEKVYNCPTSNGTTNSSISYIIEGEITLVPTLLFKELEGKVRPSYLAVVCVSSPDIGGVSLNDLCMCSVCAAYVTLFPPR